MRVFLDSNVLFSASRRESAMGRMLGMALERAEPLTSELACAEARRNLMLKRSSWLKDFDELVGKIQLVASARFDLPVELSDKDLPILCAAIGSSCSYLVTGDQRDFGHLYDHVVMGVEVIRPRRLAELLVAQ
ncbi:MAG: PIN domain-containing protein [Planctomycetota bacterium]|jgi:predicted nucleic acid-binding protein